MSARMVYISILVILAIPLFVGFFYLFEDWVGSRSLAFAEADAAAHGLDLDTKHIPPPIPASQNLAAIPLFAIKPGTKYTFLNDEMTDYNTRSCHKKSDESALPLHLPYLVFKFGEPPPDPVFVRTRLLAIVKELHPELDPGEKASLTDLFDLICPYLPELRTASKTRPDCLFTLDYSSPNSSNYSTELGLLQTWRAFANEGQLAVMDRNPELVFEDYELTIKIINGIKKDHLLIPGMISVAILEVELVRLSQELDSHLFSDDQLAKMDSDLKDEDFIALGKAGEEGDLGVFYLPLFRQVRDHRRFVTLSMIEKDLSAWHEGASSVMITPDTYSALHETVAPDGYYDLDMSDQIEMTIQAQSIVDLTKHRVYPNIDDKIKKKEELWVEHVGSSQLGSTLISFRSFARAQTWADQARIAFRLERYYLVHGKYPDSLDELKIYGDLPQDPLTGEPYIYHSILGTYKLYSVGWNLLDDGGDPKVNHGNYEDPDWLWPNNTK